MFFFIFESNNAYLFYLLLNYHMRSSLPTVYVAPCLPQKFIMQFVCRNKWRKGRREKSFYFQMIDFFTIAVSSFFELFLLIGWMVPSPLTQLQLIPTPPRSPEACTVAGGILCRLSRHLPRASLFRWRSTSTVVAALASPLATPLPLARRGQRNLAQQCN